MSTAGIPVQQANNWLAPEQHLVALVKAAVAGLVPAVHVLTRKDLAGVKEAAQLVPALHIVYAGTRVADHQYKTTRYAHKWLLVAAVRNVADTVGNQAARADAGALLELGVNALTNAEVPGCATRLTPVTPPPPSPGAGYYYLPAAFEVETVFHKR